MKKYLNAIKLFLTKNTSSSQAVIKNTFRILLAEGISKGSLAILIIMIGRTFGKEVFGQYSYLNVILMFLVVFADLGLTQLTIRDYQHIDVKHRRQYLLAGLWTKGLLSFAVTALYLVILWFIADSQFLRFIGIVLLTNNLTNSFLEYMRSTFRSLQKGETELRIKFVQGVGNLLLIPLLYILKSLPINLLAQSLVTCLTIGYAWWLIHKRQLRDQHSEIIVSKKELISQGRMFSMTTLFVSLYYFIDGIIIQRYHGYEAVGIYNAAYRILFILIIPLSITSSLFIGQFRNKQETKQSTTTMYLFLLGQGILYTLVIGVIILFAPHIILALFGTDYIEAGPVLRILLCSAIIVARYDVVASYLKANDKQKQVMYATLGGLLFNVLVNLIFIPVYGIYAAARTTVCTELLVLIALFFVYFKNSDT